MVIKESFANLAQTTAEDREAVTYLTDANMNLTTQVSEHDNKISIKDAAMATIQKTIIQLQG